MARFHGKVGYGENTESSPGVWEEVIMERSYSGDVIRNSRTLVEGEKVNSDLSLGNSISIVGDDFAYGNFYRIRYVEWAGMLWTVPTVEVEHPRLILRLGEVYNGPTP